MLLNFLCFCAYVNDADSAQQPRAPLLNWLDVPSTDTARMLKTCRNPLGYYIIFLYKHWFS